MVAYVDIANMALAHLGDDATVSSIDPPEGSAQAGHCARFLPIARDTLLEMHPWNFALTRTAPALLSTAYGPWGYCYQTPANCIKVLGVLPDGYTNAIADAVEFETESLDDDTPIILTNEADAVVRYTRRVINPTRFSPLFVEALAWMTASYVAGPLIKGDEGKKASADCYSAALAMFSRASTSSARQSRVLIENTPAWITARGVDVSDNAAIIRGS